MAQFAALFGGGRGDNRGAGDLLGLLVLVILTPLIALIIQLAISRSREYLADETGARLIKNSKALASALEKIHSSVKNDPLTFGSQATSSLFIANPFRSNVVFGLFSTHPPVNERVKRLNSMKF